MPCVPQYRKVKGWQLDKRFGMEFLLCGTILLYDSTK